MTGNLIPYELISGGASQVVIAPDDPLARLTMAEVALAGNPELSGPALRWPISPERALRHLDVCAPDYGRSLMKNARPDAWANYQRYRELVDDLIREHPYTAWREVLMVWEPTPEQHSPLNEKGLYSYCEAYVILQNDEHIFGFNLWALTDRGWRFASHEASAVLGELLRRTRVEMRGPA